jgi:predicted DCC family thiol-disulfide oxidoreductase YuxK
MHSASRSDPIAETLPDPAAAREVFFDGDCPVCRREIATYRRMAGMETIVWCDVAASAPAGIDRAAALQRFHVRRVDGSLVGGAAAFLALWRASPRLRPLARALDRAPFRTVLEWAYRGFLRLRRVWR